VDLVPQAAQLSFAAAEQDTGGDQTNDATLGESHTRDESMSNSKALRAQPVTRHNA